MDNKTGWDNSYQSAQQFVHEHLVYANGFDGQFKLAACWEDTFDVDYEMRKLFIKPERVPVPPEEFPASVQTVMIEIKGTWKINWSLTAKQRVFFLRQIIERDFNKAFEKYCQEHGWQL